MPDRDPVTIDADRRRYGLPPIFVDPPRPLTDDERRHRPDVIVRDAEGGVLRHLVPMVGRGWLVYVDVLHA